MRLIESLPARPTWALSSARVRIAAGVLLVGFVVLIPTWLLLPPDDEGFFVEVASTWFQAKHFFSQSFWNPWIGLGVPEPFNETLIYHPVAPILRAAPVFSIGLLYQIQLWIALFSVWALCVHLGLRRWIAALCVLTFALSAASANYLRDFWPSIMVSWTLSPLLLLIVVKLLDSERRLTRAVLSVSGGLCASLMLLDGHAGVFPVFAIAFAAFLIGERSRAWRAWPWLGLALLVFALATTTKVYDLALESSRADGSPRVQQTYGMDWASLFLYPITHYRDDYRLIAVGGPFMVLAVIGLFHRRGRQRADGLRLAAVVSFLGWFVPAAWLPVLSGTWFFRDPFTLFAIVLAGLTLQRLWDTLPAWRPVLLVASGLQVVALAGGFFPLYRDNLAHAVDYLQGRNVATLRNAFKNRDLYAYFERRPDHASTRIYLTSGAEDHLFRSRLMDYEFAAWGFHGLRLVNGHFRGIDIHELVPVKERLHSEITGKAKLERSRTALDALNIRYVVAERGEPVSRKLVPVKRFRLDEDGAVVVAYRNPSAWPDAVALSPRVKQIDRLPSRPDCHRSGLLCADFSALKALRLPGEVAGEAWHGTTLEVRLVPSSRPAVLLVSQLYRPGWTARLSGGRSVSGYPVLSALSDSGFTAFDLPPGTRSAEIEFRPTTRMALAGLGWGTLVLGFGFIVIAPLVDRYRRRPAGPR
jgi:hypothetical protein